VQGLCHAGAFPLRSGAAALARRASGALGVHVASKRGSAVSEWGARAVDAGAGVASNAPEPDFGRRLVFMAIRLIAPERTARSATWAAARRKALTKTKVFNRQEV